MATQTAPETAQAETDVVFANGVGLFVRSIGRGPDVVVLHGGPGASHRSLLPGFDALAKGRRLRYYDQRGCGESYVSADKPLGFHDHVRDLKGLIDEWRLERVSLIGHSWGALLALLFTSQYPECVGRLALVSPAALTAKTRAEFGKRLAKRIRALKIIKRQRELIGSGLRKSSPEAFRQRAFELTLEPFLKNPGAACGVPRIRVAQRARAAVWRSLGEYDLGARVAKLCVPSLVIHGRFDPIPLTAAQRTARLLGAKIEVFGDSGHMPFLEEHNRFVAVMDGFLPRTQKETGQASHAYPVEA